jgi:A/G-specific adenine glycosylase
MSRKRSSARAEGGPTGADEARTALLAWFDQSKRDLPWRRTRDVYRIWISEVMLQQTRVDTVVPYYERFLERFPTIEALAGAPIDDVIARWSGLGYYRRARNLHLAAKEVVLRFGAELPSSVEELRSLPGVGDYTSRAVASIGFGRHVALLDGNVARVIARLRAVAEPVDKPATRRRLLELALELCSAERPGDSNQAMMELGATVCTPAAPRCDSCPLAAFCEARRAQRVKELPVVSKAAKPQIRAWSALVIEAPSVALDEARLLLCRRPDEGLFAGLWEPPTLEGSLEDLVAKLEAVGVVVTLRAGAASIGHVLSHRKLEVAVRHARLEAKIGLEVREPPPPPPYVAARWVARSELATLGISTLARKVLAAPRGVTQASLGLFE